MSPISTTACCNPLSKYKIAPACKKIKCTKAVNAPNKPKAKCAGLTGETLKACLNPPPRKNQFQNYINVFPLFLRTVYSSSVSRFLLFVHIAINAPELTYHGCNHHRLKYADPVPYYFF